MEPLRSSVKIYSGGTAVVTREHALPKDGPLKLSIPVKRRDLDAVVTSLSVLGNVTLPEPPSYQPGNLNPTELSLDASNVTKDLATKLRGAKVRLTAAGQADLSGTLAGIQESIESLPGTSSTLRRWRVVLVLDNGEIRSVEDKNLLALTFTDAKDRQEIARALHRAYQQIKPDSSFVELTIVANDGAEKCAVSYTTTAPAPKTRYQLRQLRGQWELEAQAVVTNDTEEDWRSPDGGGVFVTVITGEPIDFDTDFSEVSRPRRSKQNLASESVLGAVGVEEATLESASSMEAMALGAPAAVPPAGGRVLAKRVLAASRAEGARAARSRRAVPLDEAYAGKRAQQVEAETREVGDFTVFDCPDPVIIGSNRSAIVPLKTWQVGDVTPILVYKENRHPRRPWRAVRFKNDTGIALAKGVVAVYQENDFTGKAVLESAQKGEEVILIHALENGVAVHQEHSRKESRRVRIHIKDGAVLWETVHRSQAQYKIQNKKEEDFKLEIEHPRTLTDSKLEAATGDRRPLTSTPTVTGARFGIMLSANENLVVVVRETSVEEQSFGLQAAGGALWLQQNLLSTKHPLGRNPKIWACVAAQEEVEKAQKALQDAEYQANAIAEEQERLKGIIPVTHDNTANDLKTDVGENEKKWRALKRETIPALTNVLREKQAALQQALASLAVSWNADDDGGERGEPLIRPGQGAAPPAR
jgi:hypothetical protein